MTSEVQIADEGPVRTIRMNRPDKKNALTAAMYDAMAAPSRMPAPTPESAAC